jgi:protein involved in polysaccharide export with SLBB domain
MKNVPLLTTVLLAVLNSAAAQTQNRPPSPNSFQSVPASQVARRSRVVGDQKVANHVQRQRIADANSVESSPEWGNISVANASLNTRQIETEGTPVQRTSMPVGSAGFLSGRVSTGSISASDENPNSIYRVGVGDVLDIRLLDLPTRESTLFTVLKDAVIEYPLITEPLTVAGLTTQQIAATLAAKIKVIRSPRLVVTVRDYASHVVLLTGLVQNPGRKILRREAMPLYAILADARPLADGFAVTITHTNGKIETVALSDSAGISTLVFSGDAVKVNGKPANARRFLYIGGAIAAPGEKEFREGITLTQLLLAAGGTTFARNAVITVARLNSNGFLTSSQYDLQMIQQGNVQDPILEPGDRVEVTSLVQ